MYNASFVELNVVTAYPIRDGGLSEIPHTNIEARELNYQSATLEDDPSIIIHIESTNNENNSIECCKKVLSFLRVAPYFIYATMIIFLCYKIAGN